MSGCACKCHETHPRLHCLKCAPCSDPVGEVMMNKRTPPVCTCRTSALTECAAHPLSAGCAPNLPDLTEMWARVFEEGVK